MNPTPSVPVAEHSTNVRRDSTPARLLYPAAAALLLVLTFLGFQQFYLHGQAYPAHPIAPPLLAIIVTHGVAMTTWIVLLMIQTSLIAGGNKKLHRALGWFGAVLAGVIVFVGVRVPVATTKVEPDIVLWGLHRKQFTAIPILSILVFAAFIGVAVWQRNRRELHRPLMLLGTLAVIAAATDRITGVPAMYGATIFGRIFGPFFPALIIGGLFLIAKSALTRSFDRVFAVGYAVLIVTSASIMAIAPTSAWDSVISYLLR